MRLGAVGPVLVAVWFREATVPAFELLLAEQQALAREFGKVTYLAVALEMPRMPSKEANDWMRAKGDFGGTVRETIVLILARGLAAVFVRSVAAAASLFTREKYRVVKSVADAARAVRELEGQPRFVADMATLERDLEAFIALPR